jgi:nucleoside transporter
MSNTDTSGATPVTSSLKTNVSLAVMMFLQYMLVAVFWGQLSAYLPNAHVTGTFGAVVLASMGIGSMFSPILCALADRYISAQKVLALTNFFTAAFLGAAAWTGGQEHPHAISGLLILAGMLTYMPSWALTSAIAMTHAKPENFPRIRTFGSIGWVASGLFSVVALNIWKVPSFDSTALPLYCGAGIALVAAVLNIITLPETPPKGGNGEFSVANILGLKAFSLLKDRNYLVFVIGSFVATIAFVLYFSFCGVFLKAKGFEYITVTLNWGQAAEMVFMFLTTTILLKVGVKKALLIGLGFMTLRYLSFYLGDVNNIESLYILGILFHGLIFGLFFAGGQVYTNQKAPKEMLAQAQGMYAFLIWGVAITVGTFIYGHLIEVASVTTVISDATAGAGTTIKKVTDWSGLFSGTTILSFVSFLVFLLFFKDEKKVA